MIVLVLTALLWITKRGPFGGWGGFLQQFWGEQDGALVGDSTVALFMVVVMFIVSDGKGGRLLDWKSAVNIPWGILLLFGGGLVIGSAFRGVGAGRYYGAVVRRGSSPARLGHDRRDLPVHDVFD